MALLHGILHVTILEAEGLQNPLLFELANAASRLSTRRRRRRRCSWMKRVSSCLSSRRLAGDMEIAATKLYATVDLDKARLGRTRVIIPSDPVNPRWDESFRIYCAHVTDHVVFTLKSANPIGASLLGRGYLSAASLLGSSLIATSLDICDEQRRPIGGRIRVSARYVAVASRENEEGWEGGVANAFFKQRENCMVTLYHDAHVDRSFNLPEIPLAGGEVFRPGKCWEDLQSAISGARVLIYIAGWSVYARITLVREGKGMTLGELLKKKAAENVRVLMLVWDDRSSVMKTHDEDTREYFRGTGVQCVLCPRNSDVGESYVQGLEVAGMFTHHQKTVTVDWAEEDGGRRRIASFVGGLDLCDGRYDTQRHALFGTLAGEHRGDFHQPSLEGASARKGGPREPWHDVHCRVEGAAAWDVLCNFEQRWRKQGADEELLVRLRDARGRFFVTPEEEEEPAASHRGNKWNVQVFRSIDGGAVQGFPESPEAAAAMGLVTGKDNVVDRSIQDAYINAIRRAKNFIYIENQYFLGSSYAWKEEKGFNVEDIGALHLIPKELSLKISSKINAGERFAVYVVVPMWPEGVPESGSVQAILDWQRRTMEMMYADVATALRKKGIAGRDTSPRDYLNFFCLGNREVKKVGEYEPSERPEPDSDYSRAQLARRFMIYVHAKTMIVDDEYIIVGSANINQRSMDGGRDSEIAIGAYQPSRSSSIGRPAKGQVHGFRMSLWYEHLGTMDDDFLRPESSECVAKVRRNADERWQIYLGTQQHNDMMGHLLSYPIGIDGNGEIAALPGLEFFPDTRARVLGSRSDYLPTILTT